MTFLPFTISSTFSSSTAPYNFLSYRYAFSFLASSATMYSSFFALEIISSEETPIALQFNCCAITRATVVQALIPVKLPGPISVAIKSKSFGRSVPIGFINYPVSQAADITAFQANLVPVGEDQEPMLEQTREIVRAFNRIYKKDVLRECKALLPENKVCLRLPGTDGNEKMSKSIGNCIYLSDDSATIKKKVNSIVTFPRDINEPGILKGNVLFTYLEAFCNEDSFKEFYPEFKNLDELKKAYKKGGIGDGTVKKFLYEVLNKELEPIAKRRAELADKKDELMAILKEGTEKANKIADETLRDVKDAMGINYFK